MFRTGVLDAQGNTRDMCILCEPIRRRPVLPGSAPHRCPAVRRLDLTRSWYVRVSDSIGMYVYMYIYIYIYVSLIHTLYVYVYIYIYIYIYIHILSEQPSAEYIALSRDFLRGTKQIAG